MITLPTPVYIKYASLYCRLDTPTAVGYYLCCGCGRSAVHAAQGLL